MGFDIYLVAVLLFYQISFWEVSSSQMEKSQWCASVVVARVISILLRKGRLFHW